jgi:Cu/Ag efflux protein CusF/plastocyanin
VRRLKTTLEESLEGHQAVARSCKKPRNFRRIILKGGVKFAREGEVFGFDKREIRLRKCEEVELTFENTDSVRHAFMTPTLNPMFLVEFSGPGNRTARFVTPDEDITLEFHCHVPLHEQMGMNGRIVVGKGGAPKIASLPAKKTYVGKGTVIALQPRKGQIVVDHEEIKGFMAAMIMGYPVEPVTLLENLKPGDVIRFTIDPEKKAIVDIKRWDKSGTERR